jgi:hypothetical protein
MNDERPFTWNVTKEICRHCHKEYQESGRSKYHTVGCKENPAIGDGTLVWFGKHKGKKWWELDDNSIDWYRHNMDGEVKRVCDKEWDRRTSK